MLPAEPPKPTYSAAPAQRKAGSSKAMKLGGKNKDVDSFVDQVSVTRYLFILEFEIITIARLDCGTCMSFSR